MRSWSLLLLGAMVCALVMLGCSSHATTRGAAANGAHPESVRVDFFGDGGATATCAGTLLSSRVVLTAAHCADHSTSARVVAGAQTSSVSSVRTFDWKAKTNTPPEQRHDVALLILRRPIAIAAYAKVQSKPCAGCAVAAIEPSGDGFVVGDAQRATPKSTKARPYQLQIANGASLAGAAVLRAGSSAPWVVGVSSTRGTSTGRGYVTRLDGREIQEWIRGFVLSSSPTSKEKSKGSSTKTQDGEEDLGGGGGDGSDPPAEDPVGDPPPDDTQPAAGDAPAATGDEPTDPSSAPSDTAGSSAASDPNADPNAPKDPNASDPQGDYTPPDRAYDVEYPNPYDNQEELDLRTGANYFIADGADHPDMGPIDQDIAERMGDNMFLFATHGSPDSILTVPPADVFDSARENGTPVLFCVCDIGQGGMNSIAGQIADEVNLPRDQIVACTGVVDTGEGGEVGCGGDWVDGNGNVIEPPNIPNIHFYTFDPEEEGDDQTNGGPPPPPPPPPRN